MIAAEALRFSLSTVLVLILTCLSIIDFRIQRLPDAIVLPLLASGLALNVAGLLTTPLDSALGAVAGYLSLWTIGALYSFRLKDAFGGGDLKLAAALGAWLGLSHLPVLLLAAFLIGTCCSLPFVLTGRCRLDQRIPFGPALAAGGVISLLGGQTLLTYLTLS